MNSYLVLLILMYRTARYPQRRLRLAPLSLSPLCVTRKKMARKNRRELQGLRRSTSLAQLEFQAAFYTPSARFHAAFVRGFLSRQAQKRGTTRSRAEKARARGETGSSLLVRSGPMCDAEKDWHVSAPSALLV